MINRFATKLVVLALTLLTAQGGLPEQIRRTLSRQFPGWEFATLASSHQPNGSGSSPAWLAEDFDGDSRMDYVVQLVAPSSHGPVQRVLGFLRRGPDYILVPLDSFPPVPSTYLQLVPQGAVRANLDADEAGTRTFRLPHVAVDIVYDDQAAKTCWYAVPTFRCVLTGD